MLFSELIIDGIRKILFRLTEIIYLAIRGLYNLFIELSKFSLFTFDEVSEVYKRFEVILAVVMVFYVSFTAIKYIVNPEMVSDKEKGGANLLKKMVVVVILMVFSPQIFEAASKLRTNIIENGVIPQIITGEAKTANNAGGEFSAKVLNLFYYAKKPNADCNLKLHILGFNTGLPLEHSYTCGQVVYYNLEYIKTVSTLSGGEKSFTNAITREDDDGYLLNFDAIYAIGVGLFLVWVFINYCAEAARVIFQMMFLEIIAPIPIMSYLSPSKDGTFQKWVKQLTATYFDVIIRLFVIYLMFFFSGKVLNSVDKILANSNRNDKWMEVFLVVFLIIGLLYFASKAPALIKELLPKGLDSAASGSFGFGKKDFKDRFNPSARVAGAALGLTRGPLKGLGRLAGSTIKDIQNNGNPFSKNGVKERYNSAREGIKKAGRRASNRFATRVDRWLGRDEAAMNKRAKREKLDEELEELSNLRGAKRVAKRNEIAQKYIANKVKIAEYRAELEALGSGPEYDKRRDDLNKLITKLENDNAGHANSLKDKVNIGALDKLAQSSVDVTKQINGHKENIENQDKEIAKQDAIISDNSKTPAEKEEARKKKQIALVSKQKSENAIRRINDVANKEKVDNYVTALSEKENADKEYREALAGSDLNKIAIAKNAKDAADNRFNKASDAMLGRFGVIHSAYNDAFMQGSQNVTKARQELYKAVLDEQTAHMQEDAAFREEKNLAQQNGGIVRGLAGFVGGTISGAAKGVAQGLKTKEIDKVLPDYVKGVKADIKQEEARQKFISEGGVVGIGADLSRLAQKAGNVIGVPTTADRIGESIKPLENMTKGEEATVKVEDDAVSATDKAISSIASAREKGKTYVSFQDKDGNGIDSTFLDNLAKQEGGSKKADGKNIKLSDILSFTKHDFKDANDPTKTILTVSTGLSHSSLTDYKDTRDLQKDLHNRTEQLRMTYEEEVKKKQLSPDQINELYRMWNDAADDEQKLTKALDKLVGDEILSDKHTDFVVNGEVGLKSELEAMRASTIAALSIKDTREKVLRSPEISSETMGKISRGDYNNLSVNEINKIHDAIDDIRQKRKAVITENREYIRQATDAKNTESTQFSGYNGSGGNSGGSGH